MKKTNYILCALLIWALGGVAYAQQLLPGTWLPNGPVYSIAEQGDMVYVGGSFTHVTRSSSHGAMYNLESGQYLPSPYPFHRLHNVVPDYAGGFFVSSPNLVNLGGVTRRRLAHIQANGSVGDFNPTFQNNPTVVHIVTSTPNRVIIFTRGGNSAQNILYCMDHNGTILWSRQADNRIINGVVQNSTLYVVGQFMSFEGQSRQRAAAFDINTGSLLPWSTGTAIPTLRTSIGSNIFNDLITIGASGQEIFIRYSASPSTLSSLIAVNGETGSPTGWSVPSPSGTVDLPMMVQSNKVFLATNAGTGLAIYDCATKQSLPLPAVSVPLGSSNRIKDFSAQGSTIYFTAASIQDANGSSLGSVVSFDAGTNQVTSLNMSFAQHIYTPSFYSISTIAVSGANFYCGGEFPGVETVPRMNFFAFNRITQELSTVEIDPESIDAVVTKIIATENRLYLQGYFSTVNGYTPNSDIISLDRQTGVLLSDFSAPVNLYSWSALAHAGDYFYVGGNFNNPGTATVIKINANTGVTEDWQLGIDLTFVTSVAATQTQIVIVGRRTNNALNEIFFIDPMTGAETLPSIQFEGPDGISGIHTTEIDNDVLYIGGAFNNLVCNGVDTPRHGFASIDLASGLVTDFVITQNGTVKTIDVTNGTVYLGGTFQQVNGLNRYRLAALSTETRQVTDWQPTLANGDPNVIVALSDGVFVGGEFSDVYFVTPTPEYLSPQLVKLTPDRSNRIEGRVFYDTNQNGVQDTGENGIPNLLIEVQPGNIFYPTDINGDYAVHSAAGEFTIRPVQPNYTTYVSPGSRVVSFDDFDQQSTGNNFGLAIQANATDISVAVVADQSLRPGFYFNYITTYKNEGTVASSGTITLQLDDRLLFQSSSTAPLQTLGNTLTFAYSNLAPGQSGSITVNVRVPVPNVQGSLMGQVMTANAAALPAGTDLNSANNEMSISNTVVGSFDPNDKLVTPAGEGPNGYIAENTDFLEYTIRFQNMGTAPAEFVIVNDILDINLEVSSFTYISASHSNNFQIIDRTLTVTFNNIQLPPETDDEPGSHGFFTFRIHLNDNLVEGTVIENSANITFDYNLPIVTNTVVNTLLDPPYYTTLFLLDSTAQRNSEIAFPVLVRDFDDLLGQQFSISWDPNVVTFEGVNQFAFTGIDANSFNTTQADQGYITFVWTDPSATPRSLPDSSALFFIRFTLTGNYGSSTPVAITSYPTPVEAVDLNYETLDVIRLDGAIRVSADLIISGNIRYANDEPVQNVVVTIGGSATLEEHTNNAGYFEIIVQPTDENAAYTVTPSKTNDPNLLNGIDVQDVATIRRHILRTETFNSPLQIIAADASNNNNVSIQDIILLQAIILGIENDLPNGRQWTFVDAGHQFFPGLSPFPYPQAITTSAENVDANFVADFTAIKIGDVNVSRDNSQTGRTQTQEVVLEISPLRETQPGIVEVEIKTFGFVDISAYQMTLSWNPNELEWIETIDNSLAAVYGSHRVNDGILTSIWDDVSGSSVSFTDQSVLTKLRFAKKTDEPIGNLTINGSATPLKMFDINLNAVNVTVREGSEEKRETGIFYPNPFVNETKISFTASESQTAPFEIIDISGRTIRTDVISLQKGWNEKYLSGEHLKPGMYIFKLQLKDKMVIGKMIKGRG
jgi:uncharacterized repeat protein (TIGR01451 family)